LAPLSLVDDHSMLAFTTAFGEPCVAIGGVIIDVGATCGCLVAIQFSLWPSSLKGAKTRCWNLLLHLLFFSHISVLPFPPIPAWVTPCAFQNEPQWPPLLKVWTFFLFIV
jgi:hypothetical protein